MRKKKRERRKSFLSIPYFFTLENGATCLKGESFLQAGLEVERRKEEEEESSKASN